MRFLFLSYNNFVPAVNGKKVKKITSTRRKTSFKKFQFKSGVSVGRLPQWKHKKEQIF
jgi:hypothetical protein